MNIAYINNIDLPGKRFNGFDLQKMLNEKGITSRQIVMDKLSDDNNVISLQRYESDSFMRKLCIELEEELSLQSVIYPFAKKLEKMKEFQDADIAHFHLIFNQFLSLYDLVDIFNSKPTVLSIHDPWFLTGHCIYPVECKKWLEGCKECSHLDRISKINKQMTDSIWNIKRDLYKKIKDIDIVVYSKWMLDLLKKSPLTQHFKNIHLINFGIDLNKFYKNKNLKETRKIYNINQDDFVIMFREDPQEWKGLEYIKKMLRKLSVKKKVSIITVGATGLLEDLRDKYDIYEYGWINDDDKLAELYSISDLFLMPSVAESFGLMAIEAMASSLPVIVFEGTALPSVTFANKCGISLKKEDEKAFVNAVEGLINNPKECIRLGNLGRKLAEENYDINIYNNNMINLYKEVYRRKCKK